jgi:hypothetical protein
MARDITVTFEDGTQHVYRNAPDDITPDAVTERAKRDFGKAVTALDGGRGGAPEQPAAAVPQPVEPQPAEPEAPVGQIPGPAPGQVAPPAFEPPTPMTTGGTVGGIFRGAALPLAGAAAGQLMAGTPGALAGGAAGVLAPVVADPLISAFNRVFGTDLPSASSAFQDLLTRAGVQVPRASGERFAQEATTGVAAGVTVPAQAARIAQAVSAGTRAAPVVAPIAEAVRVSGMGPTGAGGVPGRAGLGARVGAGATSGMIGAAPVAESPTDVAVGGVAGGAMTPLAAVGGDMLRATGQLAQTVIQPAATTAGRQIFRDIGGTVGAAERAIESIRAGSQVPMTPGFRPTLPEIIVAGGGEAPTALAVRAERIAGASAEMAQDIARRMNERAGALQAQLARVNQQIDQQGAVLRKEELDKLTVARDALRDQLEREGAAAEQALRSVSQRLPAGQQEPGTPLAKRLDELTELTRREQVDPRYETAKRLGGATPNIEVTPIIAAVEDVLGKPIHTFNSTTGPRVARILQREIPRPDVPPGSAVDPNAPLPTQNVFATLRVAHDIRSAVNDELASAYRAGDEVRARSLMEIKSAIDEAIDGAPALAKEAKDAYREANKYYSEVFKPRFGEQQAGLILADTTFGRTKIMPSNIVDAFTRTTDGAKQFVRTFAGDPQAYADLRQGILGKYRLATVNAKTGMVDEAKSAQFLQDNAEVLSILENNGLRIRGQIENFQESARLTSEYMQGLKSRIKGFEDKSNDAFLDYITSDPARMQRVLRNADDQTKEIVRGVIATRLNNMLTKTAEGVPLTEADTLRVLSTLYDSTGNLKGAYKLALGDDLARQFRERALGLRSIISASKSPIVDKPNAIAPLLRKQDYTPEQLTNLQVVVNDIERAKRIAAAAADARKSPKPSGRDVFEEEAEGAPFRPDKINLLDRTYTIFRNTYLSLQDRMSPKVAAELSNMIYNHPEAAVKALQEEVRRAQRVAKPAGLSRIAPVTSGIQAGGLSSTMQFVPEPQPEPQQ